MTSAQLVDERPPAGVPKPWSFPSFERREIAGGRVIAAHLPGRPLAVVSLVVDAGAVTEPDGREGVAALLSSVLSEGTERHDAYEFAVAGERIGAGWHADADWDSLRCGFEVPAGHVAEAAELLADAVRRPRFDPDAVARVHAERLDELQIERSQPRTRAAIAFADAVFRRPSRYAIPAGGDVDTVTAIDAGVIRAFHAERLASDTATLVLVGDLDGTDVDAVAAAVFDGWAAAGATRTPPVITPEPPARRVVFVDRPGSVQSILYVGHDGPSRAIADYVALTTMALGLGGMFNSRLMTKLREEKGYTYGAYGGFDCRRDGGVFLCRTAVQTEVTGAALEALIAEVEDVHGNGLRPDEVEHARDYRAGVFPVNFAGTPQVANGLAELVVHGHPDDHFDRLRADILAITKDELDAAARAHVRPAELVSVVVGDAEQVLADVEALGLGPVTVVRDADEQ